MNIAQLHGLYLITPDINDTTLLINKVTCALKGGARLVQYRNKQASHVLQQQQAQALRSLCDTYSALLLINDDPALALFVKADGVHLGQSDMQLTAARTLLGKHAIIGVTCHDQFNLAQQAANNGADYLSFGRFFSSTTKPNAPAANPTILTQAKNSFQLPIAAIGGITRDNAKIMLDAGADMLAVCAGIFAAENIEAETRLWNNISR